MGYGEGGPGAAGGTDNSGSGNQGAGGSGNSGLNNPNNLSGHGDTRNVRDISGEQDRRQRGYGDRGGNQIPESPPPPPPQFIGPAAPKFEPRQLGGSSTGNYQTQSPNYSDLTAKHQAGFSDSETGETQTPNMFNFNGTVYSYNPENSAFTDTYTGTEITSDNGETGSRGIAGIYGPGGGKPYERDMGGLEAVHRPTAEELQRVNPEWTQYQEDKTAFEASPEYADQQELNQIYKDLRNVSGDQEEQHLINRRNRIEERYKGRDHPDNKR